MDLLRIPPGLVLLNLVVAAKPTPDCVRLRNDDFEPLAFEGPIRGDRASDVADAHNHDGPRLIATHHLSEPLQKIDDLIPTTWLAE